MSAVNGAVVDVQMLQNSEEANITRSINKEFKLQGTNEKFNMSGNTNNLSNSNNKSSCLKEKYSENYALPLPLPSPQQRQQEEWYDSYYQDDFTDSSEDYLYSSLGTSVGQAPVKRKKTILTRTLLPNFVSTHGRTVYGGNPIVQQTLPGYFAYPSPFILIPIVFIIMIPFIVVGTCLVVMSHRFYQIDLEYSGINKYQYMPMAVSDEDQVQFVATNRQVERSATGFATHTSDDRVNPNYGIRHFYVDGVDYPQGTRTWVNFTLRKRMRAPVLFKYSIRHLHQNYREFHRGRSINQLRGKTKIGKITDCKPFTSPDYLQSSVSLTGNNNSYLWVNYTDNNGQVVSEPVSAFTYNPCGMAAYAMFNDTFILYKVLSSVVNSSTSGIISDGNKFSLYKSEGERVTVKQEPLLDTENGYIEERPNKTLLNNYVGELEESESEEEEEEEEPLLQRLELNKTNAVNNVNALTTSSATLQLICNGSDFDATGNPLYQSESQNFCTKRHISWKADRTVRFAPLQLRPDWWSRYYPYNTSNPFLNNGWYLNEAGHTLPDPSDEDFQVWMKSSVLASFHKLYRVIDVDLLPGNYAVQVNEFYDTVSFNGKKGIVISSQSWVGSNSVGMGIVFLVIGGLCFVLGVSFSLEFILQRNGFNRYAHLPSPKRDWYYFDSDSQEFEKYYQLRLERHLLVAKLRTLQRLQNMDSNYSSSLTSSSS